MMMKLDMGIFTYRMNYGIKIEVPTYIWFIEGSEKKIIVDSGGDPGFAYNRGIEVKEIMTFNEALAQVHLRPDEIDMIIHTHLHWDHCGNSFRCRRAEVVVQERELEFALDPHPLMANVYQKSVFQDLRYSPVRGACEIQTGIGVVPVPGHSPGAQAVYVETDAGKCVISGFCSIGENFLSSPDAYGSEVVAPGIHTDALAAYDSSLLVKEMADILLPQHDPEVMRWDSIPKDA